MSVGAEVDDPDFAALVACGLLQEREKVRGQNYMAHVVECHVSVEAVLGNLLRHDTSRGVVDQNVQSISRVADFFRHLDDLLPVAKVALHPVCALGSFFAQVLLDGISGTFDHFL